MRRQQVDTGVNMKKKQRPDVLTGDIKQHLIRFAIPSMGGMFAMTVFNLTDTYFVSQLGTDALAAMGFTFPVVMIIGSVSGGISLGASSVLARAMGAGDHHKTQRIATDGILMSLLMVLFVSILGLFFLEEIFTALGAEGQALVLVKQYMTIWFAGAVFVIVPPVSDASMRALGDMVRPLVVMLSIAILNIILDPILIFGYFGVPAMGIEGAVIATVVSRAIGGLLSLSFVAFHYKLIDFKYNSWRELLASWREIITIGIPNIINRLLPQAIRASMTRLVAGSVGVAAVAAIAAGQRIESFATIASMGIGTAIVPIIGQNYGKGQKDRVMEMRQILIRLAIVYGLVLFLIMLPLGSILGSIFTSDPEVLALTAQYIRIIMIGTIGLNQYSWISESFTAVGKPKFALLTNLIGTLLIIIPLMFIGVNTAGFVGMLVSIALGQLLVGLLAIWMSKKWLV